MRLWHRELLPYLPDLQFRGQLREAVAIMRSWRDTGKTNHLLINRVMEYPKNDFVRYFLEYDIHYHKRYGKYLDEITVEFLKFNDDGKNNVIFEGWHNKEYLRVCMANLYEKHIFGIGKSRITDEEWARLCEGYKTITGEEYLI
jgi:uncharacterized protein (TIGR02328 family)